jgi:DNA-binding NarL/FixJ family response regulator
MLFWQRLLYLLGLRQDPHPHTYTLDSDLHLLIADLAQQEQRSEQEIHADLLAAALTQRQASREVWRRWETLSRREQDVAALACLGYTNHQIAHRLGLSAETVKTHVRNVLTKFSLHSKGELRTALSGWDFRAWESAPQR